MCIHLARRMLWVGSLTHVNQECQSGVVAYVYNPSTGEAKAEDQKFNIFSYVVSLVN